MQVPGRTPSGATNRRHGPVSHLSNMWETELKRQPGPGAEHVKCHPSFRPALTRGLTHSTHTTTQTRTRAAIQCPWAVLAIGGSFLLTRKAQSGFFSMLSEPLVRLVLSDLSLRSFASLPLLLLDSLPVLATSSLLTVLGGVFAQRGHSTYYYYVVHPGNTPENETPTEACTINLKPHRGCRNQDPGTHGYPGGGQQKKTCGTIKQLPLGREGCHVGKGDGKNNDARTITKSPRRGC